MRPMPMSYAQETACKRPVRWLHLQGRMRRLGTVACTSGNMHTSFRDIQSSKQCKIGPADTLCYPGRLSRPLAIGQKHKRASSSSIKRGKFRRHQDSSAIWPHAAARISAKGRELPSIGIVSNLKSEKFLRRIVSFGENATRYNSFY